MKFQEKLENLNACSNAIDWCKNYSSLQKAWDACERADWSLWIVGNLSGKPGSQKRKKLVLCACEIARLSLRYVPNGETRPLKAIETAEKFAGGDKGISLQNVRNAADAAAYAASRADDAANAKKEMQIKCAEIVRKHYPKAPRI